MDLTTMSQWLKYLQTKQELQAQRTGAARKEGKGLEVGRDLRKSVRELKLQVEGLRKASTAVHTRQNSTTDYQSAEQSSCTAFSLKNEDWCKARPPTHPPCPRFYLLCSQHCSLLLYKDTSLHMGITSERSVGFHIYSSVFRAEARACGRSVVVQVEPRSKVIAAGQGEAVTAAVKPIKVVG